MSSIKMTRQMLEQFIRETVSAKIGNKKRKLRDESNSSEDAYLDWLRKQEAANLAYAKLQQLQSKNAKESLSDTGYEYRWEEALSDKNAEAGYEEWLDRLADGYKPKRSDFKTTNDYKNWKANFGPGTW